MKKEMAEYEKEKHAGLQGKIFVHKKYNAEMKVVEIGIAETCSKTNDFFVYCRLEGKLGKVTETLEYVLNNYRINQVTPD